MKTCPELLLSIKSQGTFLRQNIKYFLEEKREQLGGTAERKPERSVEKKVKESSSHPKPIEPREPRPAKDLRWLNLKVGDIEIGYERYKKVLQEVIGNKKIKKLARKYASYTLTPEIITLTQDDIDDVIELFRD